MVVVPPSGVKVIHAWPSVKLGSPVEIVFMVRVPWTAAGAVV